MNLKKMIVFFVICFCFVESALAQILDVNALPEEILIDAMMQKESKKNPFALGDKKIKDHAYGILQIRQPVLDDVNRVYGTHYTNLQCYDVATSVEIFHKYIAIWKKPGMKNGDMACIWNGGPSGPFHPKPITVRYWADVRAIMISIAEGKCPAKKATQVATTSALKKKRVPVIVSLVEVTRPRLAETN